VHHKFRFKNKLLSIDATTIELCATVFDWAQFRGKEFDTDAQRGCLNGFPSSPEQGHQSDRETNCRISTLKHKKGSRRKPSRENPSIALIEGLFGVGV
jgi:hypothetical protein